MKKTISLIESLIPAALRSTIDLGLNRRSYGQFKVILFTIMMLISIGPVFTIAGLGYYNYIDLLHKDEKAQLSWQLDGAVRGFSQLIENLKAVVLFTAKRDRYEELIDEANLEALFVRINRQYPYFADLGVIDHNGVQQSYYGPYDLLGTNYAHEEWFKEVYDRGVYISNVYKGYRQVPHFAIAVSNLDPNTRKIWILRATIDASTLQQYINTIKTDASDDLFLIDRNGFLQTYSEYYGRTLRQINLRYNEGFNQSISVEGETINYAVGNIDTTPWSLVLKKKHYMHESDWISFRNRLVFIVLTCMLITIMIVYSLVTLLTSLIRKADDAQLVMLKEAEHTDKLASIGRLAAGVGHEINNPLAIINQKTGLIQDLLEISENFEHKNTIGSSLMSINQSVERCKAITHRLLGFARRTEVHTETLNVNEIVGEVLQFLDNSMVYRRIRIDLKLEDDLPMVNSDRTQLQQIFLNIINNAIDAIDKDGEITIITHELAGDIRVVISDDGPGIDQEILSQIFEPFFTTKETGEGTGLGLSITYGLIKKLGGDITVRSQLGHGTAFTITIPVNKEGKNEEPREN